MLFLWLNRALSLPRRLLQSALGLLIIAATIWAAWRATSLPPASPPKTSELACALAIESERKDYATAGAKPSADIVARARRENIPIPRIVGAIERISGCDLSMGEMPAMTAIWPTLCSLLDQLG